MPGVNPPNSNLLPYVIANINNRVRALETQQQLVISNLQGQPIMVTGLQPGSVPPMWGLGFLRKSFKTRAAFFGESSTGTVSMKFYAANGTTVLLEVDATGLSAYDTGGHTRAQLGKLPGGDYGLSVTDPAGHSSEIWPVSADMTATTVSTTSTTPVSLAGTPSVTCEIGSSGDAVVTFGAFIKTNTAANQGQIWLTLNGTTVGYSANLFASSGYAAGTVTRILMLSKVGATTTAGSHTFALKFASSTGVVTNFDRCALVVQPI